jgi:hypothetical protein
LNLSQPTKPKLATITPITKDDLRSWEIKFIAIDVPTFAISIKKNCKTICHFFKTKEEAKTFIENQRRLTPIIIYDVEKVYKEKATRPSKLVKEDCFYIQLADINNADFTKVYENVKNTKDAVYRFNWDFSNSALK